MTLPASFALAFIKMT